MKFCIYICTNILTVHKFVSHELKSIGKSEDINVAHDRKSWKINTETQGVSGGICHSLGKCYVNLHPPNEIYLLVYTKLNGYGCNHDRKIWSPCAVSYCTCLTWCIIRTVCRSIQEPIDKPSRREQCVLCKVPRNIRKIFMKLVRVFLT
jgi:hypothetical protein